MLQGVQGISNLITIPGLINLDFADVKTIMQDTGSALMGIGQASGENRAVDAARKAISSPLLETSIEGAKGVLLNFTGGPNLTLLEVNEASEIVGEAADQEANIIFGAVIDENLKDDLRVTVIATGFDQRNTVVKKPKGNQEPVGKGENHNPFRDNVDIPNFLKYRR